MANDTASPQSTDPPADEAASAHTQPESDALRSAIRDPWAHVRLWTFAIVFLTLDLWSKAWAFASLGPADVRDAVPGLLSFRRSVNPGALFGMGKGLVPVFVVASFVAVGFVLFLFAASTPKRWALHFALSCVIAGSLGNLYDRSFVQADKIVFADGSEIIGKVVENDPASDYIRIGAAIDGVGARMFPRDGATITQVGIVRDFLKIEPKVRGHDVWPWVFNIADSLLVVGVSILMLSFWQERREYRRAELSAAVDAPSA